MASPNESTTAKAKGTYYQSKLGAVTILTLNNYPDFQTIVVLAFMAGGWWGSYQENGLVRLKIRTLEIRKLVKP